MERKIVRHFHGRGQRFDSVRAEILGDVLPERGASAFSATAVVRENLEFRCRPCLGHTQCAPLNLDVGMRQGGPRTPSGWNQLVAFLVEELLQLWNDRSPAVSWAAEWKPFELLVWADNIFLVASSVAEAGKRTQEIANIFGKKKLLFNPGSLEILPSVAAGADKTPVLLSEGWNSSGYRFLWHLVATLTARAPQKY